MDKPPGISFAIMIASLGLVSLELQQQAASRFSRYPIMHHEPMPSVNAFWGVSGESALPHMLVLHEKQLQRVLRAYAAYFNRARPHQGIQQQVPQGEGPLCHQINVVIESSQFRSWVDYTTSTKEWPEPYNIIVGIPGARVPSVTVFLQRL
jgi:hypothetical protein